MIAEGTTAFNPQTNQTATFTGGKWVVQGSPQMPVRSDDVDQLKAMGEDATQAQWLAQKANEFMNAQGAGSKAAATGPIYKDFGIPHIAENINPAPLIGAALDPRLGQMESISNQAWTHMRPAGSGPMRMPEIEGFREAFPNVGNWGTVNQGVTQRLNQDAALATQKHQFLDDFIKSGRGTFADANAAWQAQGGSNPPPMRGQGGYQPPAPPMAVVPDPTSPVGYAASPDVAPPPVVNSAQMRMLTWTPDKGLQP